MATYKRVKGDYNVTTIGIGSNINIATGNINISGNISATGNVSGDYFLGDGSLLTNLPAGNYSNANVINLLASFGGNVVSTTGNVTAGFFKGDGSLLTNLPAGNYSNANVVSLLGALGSNSISTTGTVSASFLYGNGAFLTGISGGGGGNGTAIVNGLSSVTIPVSAGNVAVTVGFSSNVAVFTSAGLNVTGNITTNNISVSGTSLTTGNITGGNISTAGQISAVGNVSGAYIIGDGSLLTNVGGGGNYGNADVAAYLPTYTGNLAGGNISITGQANVNGNVNVQTTSRINGVVQGQLYGLTNGVNTIYGTWDFGFIAANTYNNPIQWIFAQTSAGNIDMGTVTAPASLDIDIGTIF